MENLGTKKDPKYRPKVYINGKPVTKIFTDYAEAKLWKAKQVYERNQKKDSSVFDDTITLAEYYTEWAISKPNLSRNSVRAHQSAYLNYLKPLFEFKKIKDFNFKDGNVLKSSLDKTKLSNSRKKFIVVHFKQIFLDAVKMQIIQTSPFQHLETYKVIQKESKFWQQEQVIHFLNTIQNFEHYSFYVGALNTGLRLGELMALTWDRIDLERREIVVNKSRDRDGIKNVVKNKRRNIVAINDALLEVLNKLKSENRPSDLVFVKKDGRPFSYEHFTERVFYKDSFSAGLPKITFHNLRTTYATLFCANDGNIFYLSQFLNHSSVDMTSKKYTHVVSERMQAEAKKVCFRATSSRLAHEVSSVV